MSTAPSPPAPTDASVGGSATTPGDHTATTPGDHTATTPVDLLAARRLAQHLAAGTRRWLAVPEEEPASATSLAVALDTAAGDPARTVAVAGVEGTGRLRRQATPDDLVLVVATAAAARDLCLRLTAWGPTTILLPLGATRPEAGRAHLVLPLLADHGAASERLGDIGRLLAAQDVLPGPPPSDDRGEVCITCADEAVVAEVADVTDELTATVRTPDGLVEVDTTLVAPLRDRDLLLVHARTVIAVLDPALAPTTHTTGRRLDET